MDLNRLVKWLVICGVLIWTGLLVNFAFPSVESRQKAQIEKDYVKTSAEHLLKGEWLEAQKVICEGLTHSPRCANLYFNLGLSYYLSGNYNQAKTTFRTLSAIAPYYPDVHYLLGLIYRAEGNFTEAKAEFIRELNLNPGNPRAWKEIREADEGNKKSI
ncbi:MAG: tetratricopeptide repeat protein [Candidatus Omnitrophota bacterium]